MEMVWASVRGRCSVSDQDAAADGQTGGGARETMGVWFCTTIEEAKSCLLMAGSGWFRSVGFGFRSGSRESCDDRCFRICSFQFSWQGESCACVTGPEMDLAKSLEVTYFQSDQLSLRCQHMFPRESTFSGCLLRYLPEPQPQTPRVVAISARRPYPASQPGG